MMKNQLTVALLCLREVGLYLLIAGAILVGFFLWFLTVVVLAIAVYRMFWSGPDGGPPDMRAAWVIIRSAWLLPLIALMSAIAGRRAARALDWSSPGASARNSAGQYPSP